MAVYYNTARARNLQLRELFDAILDLTTGHDHDGVNTKSVVGGVPSAGTVTNTMLATDVKVGSLAALTTTLKSSLVAALNELDAENGVLSTLTTTVKTSLVAAINELDADIGNPATLTTTSKVIIGAINELDALNSSFVTLTGVETLTNKSLTSPNLTTPLIEDGDTGLTINSTNQTHAAPVATIPNIIGAADTFVLNDTVATLTLKTLTTPTLTTPLIDDSDAGVTLTSDDQTHATPVVTIPDIIDAADVIVLNDTAATLTLKTLTSPTLTTPIVATTGAITDAGGDEYIVFTEATTPVTYVGVTSGDTTVNPQLRGAGETNTGLLLAGTGTGKVTIGDGATVGKALNFELVGATDTKTMTITSSHTDNRVLTLPDVTDTVAVIGAEQTLALKTLTTPVVATLYQDAGKTLLLTMPAATDTLVGKATTDTLTNKTLTSAILTTPVIDDGDQNVTITSEDQTDSGATITIPDCIDSADEFVLKDTISTLTLKTLITPVLASFYQDAGKTLTVNVPAATDTLVGKATTDDFTNKTYDSLGTGNIPKNIVMSYAASITRAEMITGKT